MKTPPTTVLTSLLRICAALCWIATFVALLSALRIVDLGYTQLYGNSWVSVLFFALAGAFYYGLAEICQRINDTAFYSAETCQAIDRLAAQLRKQTAPAELTPNPSRDPLGILSKKPADAYYYIEPDGETCGPVSRDELRQMYESGAISKDSTGVPAGGSDWKPVRELI